MKYEYEKDTRQAYRNLQKAQIYQQIHSGEDKWAQFASWCMRVIVRRTLTPCNLGPHEKILDIPCGSGILGSILKKFPQRLVAADISLEMMDLARAEYQYPHFLGFVQSDITQMPFASREFACILILGLMHRIPAEIRRKILAELASLQPKYVIITYSLDSLGQRLKRLVLDKLRGSYKPAPMPVPYRDIIKEVNDVGFKVNCSHSVIPILSSSIVLVLESQAW